MPCPASPPFCQISRRWVAAPVPVSLLHEYDALGNLERSGLDVSGNGAPLDLASNDRIDETEQRIRSVHDPRFHYIRTLSTGPTPVRLGRHPISIR